MQRPQRDAAPRLSQPAEPRQYGTDLQTFVEQVGAPAGRQPPHVSEASQQRQHVLADGVEFGSDVRGQVSPARRGLSRVLSPASVQAALYNLVGRDLIAEERDAEHPPGSRAGQPFRHPAQDFPLPGGVIDPLAAFELRRRHVHAEHKAPGGQFDEKGR